MSLRRLLGLTVCAALLALPAGAGAQPLQGLVQFQSPSKNIGCALSNDGARCDIREKSWMAPPKPKSCELDWGFGAAVDKAGKAGLVCAGDTAAGAGRVLPYGDRIRRGAFLCKSSSAGMKCVNTRTDHGFFLSKQTYSLF